MVLERGKSGVVVFVRGAKVLCVETRRGKHQLPGGKAEPADGGDPRRTACLAVVLPA